MRVKPSVQPREGTNEGKFSVGYEVEPRERQLDTNRCLRHPVFRLPKCLKDRFDIFNLELGIYGYSRVQGNKKGRYVAHLRHTIAQNYSFGSGVVVNEFS